MEELHRHEPHESRRPNEHYRVSVTVGLSPALESLAERYVAALEGRISTEIQKKIDEATKIIGDTSADTQAELENASKS